MTQEKPTEEITRRRFLDSVRDAVKTAAGAVATALLVAELDPKQAQAQKLARPKPMLDFTLTDQDGKTVTKKDLIGNAVIFAFQFTNCAAMCPLTTEKLKSLQKKLKGTPNVKIISVTMDPDRDTPAVIKAYLGAKKVSAEDQKQWQFLTGDKPVLAKLYDHCFPGARTVETLKPGGKLPDGPIAHSPNYLLLNKNGEITQSRSIFTADASLDSFANEVRQLANATQIQGGRGLK